MPLLKTQERQYAAKWVAIYFPQEIRKPGHNPLCAGEKHRKLSPEVENSNSLEAWKRKLEEPQVLFKLVEVVRNGSSYNQYQEVIDLHLISLDQPAGTGACEYSGTIIVRKWNLNERLFEDLTALG